MPIRWTPENDQHLLLKVLEVTSVSIDYAAVANAWGGDEKPTPKAISERIAKLKRLSKGSGPGGANGTPSAATPRKLKATNTSRTPSKKPSPKRKRDPEPKTDSDDEEDYDLPVPIKSELEESPTKKVKTKDVNASAEDNEGPPSTLGEEGGVSGFDGANEYLTPDELSELW